MVGGEKFSMHLLGSAADITVPGVPIADIAAWFTGWSGGLGVYPSRGFIHIDAGPNRRFGEK